MAGMYLGLPARRSLRCLTPKLLFGERRESAHGYGVIPGNSRDSDRLDESQILGLAHTLPRRSANLGSSLGAVNEVTVGVVEAGLLQRDLDGVDDPLGLLLVVHELGSEPDLGARDSTLLDEVEDGSSTVGLVLVPLGSVDVL